MMVAAVDLSPVVGLPIGAILVLLSVWYWQRLGREHVEPSRCAIRRASLILGVLSIFALIRAASFVDSEVSPRAYVVAWLSALGLVFLVVLLVAVDMVNSFRLHRKDLERDTLETASHLKADLEALSGGGSPSAVESEGPE